MKRDDAMGCEYDTTFHISDVGFDNVHGDANVNCCAALVARKHPHTNAYAIPTTLVRVVKTTIGRRGRKGKRKV